MSDIVYDQDVRVILAQLIAARPKQAEDVDANVALANRYADALTELRRAKERAGYRSPR